MKAGTAERAVERRRKAVHVGCGLVALSFRWLTWPEALLLALAALVFNWLVLPRLGGMALQRDHEKARGLAPGILLYPLAVAVLVLAYGPWRGLVTPAMGWALLAFGDGAASLVGMHWGRHPLPWNPRKSVEGAVAHFACGAVAAFAIGAFVNGGFAARGHAMGAIAVAAVGAAIATALLETIDSGIDDNLTVAWGGALVADALLVLAGGLSLGPGTKRALIALAACAVLAIVSVLRGSLTIAGAVAAVVEGTGIAAWAGWPAFAALCTFFVLGTGATRLGRSMKESRGIAQERGGRRGIGNVLANGGMALLCAVYAGQGMAVHAARVALVAALATAAFDTVSSEIGKAWGRTTWLVTSFRRVPPGTEGAVSLEGTLAGVGAAIVVGFAGLWPSSFAFVPVVVIAAFAGTTFESVVGALFEGRGRRLNNDLLNFANTLVGAAVAALILMAWRRGSA